MQRTIVWLAKDKIIYQITYTHCDRTTLCACGPAKLALSKVSVFRALVRRKLHGLNFNCHLKWWNRFGVGNRYQHCIPHQSSIQTRKASAILFFSCKENVLFTKSTLSFGMMQTIWDVAPAKCRAISWMAVCCGSNSLLLSTEINLTWSRIQLASL